MSKSTHKCYRLQLYAFNNQYVILAAAGPTDAFLFQMTIILYIYKITKSLHNETVISTHRYHILNYKAFKQIIPQHYSAAKMIHKFSLTSVFLLFTHKMYTVRHLNY